MPTEWTDLPPELQTMIVEKCDYISRNSLRATSFSMNLLANSSKLFIPSIRIKERHLGIHVEFTFRLWKDHLLKFEEDLVKGGTRIRQAGKEDIHVEGAEPVDLALETFRKVAVANNITIGHLRLETVAERSDNLAEKTRKMLENSGIPLKIQVLFWHYLRSDSGSGKNVFEVFLENCQPACLKEIKVYREDKERVDFIAKNLKIMEKLSRLEVNCEVLATDEHVLALKAEKIHLTSKEFTGGMVEKLLEKLTREMIDRSFFMIKRPMEGLKLEHLPEGIEKIDSQSRSITSYKKLLDNGNKLLLIKTGPFGVFAEIQKVTEDVTHYSEFREKCLKSANCCCPDTRFWPDEDGSEYDDYEDNYSLDDSFEYEYDHFRQNRGIWSDDELDDFEENEWEYEGDEDDF